MNNRYKGLSAFVILCIGLLTTCQKQEQSVITVPPNAFDGYVDLKPDVYQVNDTQYKANTGIITVPENRSDSASRLIALPIIQVLATSDSVAEPIFFLEGGPGISNMNFSQLDGLINHHDIVMVGYRGVDGSVILDGKEISDFFKNIPGDLMEPSTIESMSDAYSRNANRLISEGIDIYGYTLTEVIHDMEEARKALGYERVSLLSESYGTRLAMIYAWVYPNSIHRSAMISVNPPGHFVWYPEMIDEQLNYYSHLYRNDPHITSRTEDLAETMREVIHTMPDRWMFFPLKKGNVLMGTFMMLYHTDTAVDVLDAWIAAGEGDWSGLAMLSLAIDFMIAEAPIAWGESAAKTTSADYNFGPNVDPISEMMPPESIMGSPASVAGIAAAQGWPSNLIVDSLRQVIRSEVPTLLISGSIDFSTPMQYARDELLPYLTNGHQVILSEFGHTGDIWGLHPEATTHLLKTFFDHGTVDESKFRYQPVSFDVGFGYPEMMKLILACILIFILGLLALTIFLARKYLFRSFRPSDVS